jgi:hypothetical protein
MSKLRTESSTVQHSASSQLSIQASATMNTPLFWHDQIQHTERSDVAWYLNAGASIFLSYLFLCQYQVESIHFPSLCPIEHIQKKKHQKHHFPSTLHCFYMFIYRCAFFFLWFWVWFYKWERRLSLIKA